MQQCTWQLKKNTQKKTCSKQIKLPLLYVFPLNINLTHTYTLLLSPLYYVQSEMPKQSEKGRNEQHMYTCK